MKYAFFSARLFLGLIFVVFGLNYWFRFIPIPKADGHAADFMGAMHVTGYLAIIKGLEVLGGVLVWSGRFTALGLIILVPIIVNILCYDYFLSKGFNPVSSFAALLAVILLWNDRSKFAALFR